MVDTKSNLNHRPLTWVHYSAILIYLVLAAVAVHEMQFSSPVPGFKPAFEEAIQSLTIEGQPILARYTGIESIDFVLRILVVAFWPGSVGLDPGFQILQAYFLISFFSIISIWNIESGRQSNRRSLLTYPSIYAMFYQTIGGAIIIPCYYVAHTRTAARRTGYYSSTTRAVPTALAKALIPSLIIGYLVPTLLLYLPQWDDQTRQRLIAFWQPCPLYVSAISQALTPLCTLSKSKARDLGYLSVIYILCFTVSSTLHFVTMGYCLMSSRPDESLGAVFNPFLFNVDSPVVGGFKYIFQIDFWIIFIASLLWANFAIYDLKQEHKTELGMIQTSLCLILGSVVIGPAAVLAAVWYWREQVLAKAKAA